MYVIDLFIDLVLYHVKFYLVRVCVCWWYGRLCVNCCMRLMYMFLFDGCSIMT